MGNHGYELMGGPLDGAKNFAGRIAGWRDGSVVASVRGLRQGYRLLYRGKLAFCGRPSQLHFLGWMPKVLGRVKESEHITKEKR